MKVEQPLPKCQDHPNQAKMARENKSGRGRPGKRSLSEEKTRVGHCRPSSSSVPRPPKPFDERKNKSRRKN